MKKLLVILLLVIAVGGIGGSYYFYAKYKAIKANPNIEAQRVNDVLIAQVGKLMELPTDETPVIATVLDASKLKDQVFFKNAQNGDAVLAYSQRAMEAILYRPSVNKIISVAPIIINNSGQPIQPVQPINGQ